MNPASILALHLYNKDVGDLASWRAAAPALAPYMAGPMAAALLLGLLAPGDEAAKTASAAAKRRAPSATAQERRRRAMKAE